MMKSSIPSSWGSTREERLASGGPWCSSCSWPWAWPAAIAPASIRRLASAACLDVHAPACRSRSPRAPPGLSATHLDSVGRQRRDHDLGDVEVLHGVHRGRVRVRVADLAGGHDLLAAQDVEQRLQPLARGAHGAAVARVLRHDHDEAVRAARRRAPRACARAAPPADRLVGEHERDVERQAPRRRHVDCTMWWTGSPLPRLQALDQVAPQPARGDRRQRRDDDLVDPCARASRPSRR